MKFNEDKIDEYTLALMYLVIHQNGYGARAWKSFDWDTLDRLFNKHFVKKIESVL